MACECPAWKNYRDTEEVCEETAPVDGGIYFMDIDSNTHPSDIYHIFGYLEQGDPMDNEESDCYSSEANEINVVTNLPNAESGVWSYVFLGTMNDQQNNETFDDPDIWIPQYYGGTELDWVPFTHEGVDYLSPSTVNLKNEYGANHSNTLVFAWTGDVEIYFTLNSIVYGPLIARADRTAYLEVIGGGGEF